MREELKVLQGRVVEAKQLTATIALWVAENPQDIHGTQMAENARSLSARYAYEVTEAEASLRTAEGALFESWRQDALEIARGAAARARRTWMFVRESEADFAQVKMHWANRRSEGTGVRVDAAAGEGETEPEERNNERSNDAKKER